MKKIRILTIACWVITALALVGLATWFLTGRIFGIGAEGMSIFGWETLTGPFEVVGDYRVSSDNVNSIYIDWVAGDITAIPYDGSDIHIIESARRELRDDEMLRYSASGGTLTIKFSERSSWSANMISKNLEVYIPRALSENFDKFTVDSTSGAVSVESINAGAFKTDSVSGSLNIVNVTSSTFTADTTSGSITISFVSADDMRLDSVSGAIRISDVTARSVKGDTTSGSQELSGAFEHVDLESVSGKLTVTSTVVPASLRADSTSGGITITVPDEGAISVNFSSVSGKLTSDIPTTTKGRDAQFQLSTVSGGAKIQALG